jgi:hypothetical protein
MRRFALVGVLAALVATALAPSAQAAFALEEFGLSFEEKGGAPALQAGSHPFAVTSRLSFHTVPDPTFGEVPDGALKDLDVELPTGLVGDPTAVPACSNKDFINIIPSTKLPSCSDSSAVGVITIKTLDNSNAISYNSAPVYNLVPPAGAVQKLGFAPFGLPNALVFTVKDAQPYNVVTRLRNSPQVEPIYAAKLTLWGNPADPAHDSLRGHCVQPSGFVPTEEIFTTGGQCPSGVAEKPYITLPRACGPLSGSYLATAWQAFPPSSGNIAIPTLNGCERIGFGPTIGVATTTSAAQSPTGLNFNLDVADENLTSPAGLAQSDIRKAVVTLPEGMTLNPSLAEGLGACTRADLARETLAAAPGEGCPASSKVGTVEVETPLLEEKLDGSLYTAKPFENEAGSLIAVYLVIKNPNLGVIIKQTLKVVPDETTGRLTTVAEGIPQLPFSHFRLKFRGGERAPLTTPSGCGTYNASAVLTPWSGGPAVTTTKAFQIVTGAGGGGCGQSPFTPSFEAGTLAPLAGSYSPFVLNLSRPASAPRLSSIETTLPEGMLARLAAVTECPAAAIAAARTRSGPNQGALELAAPSCPASSEVGTVTVGAGSGAQTYVGGKAYLAGPYKGAPLSLVVIAPAVVGPFDLGSVVVRNALYVNPTTAQVRAVSDPLPSILQGIPTELRSVSIELGKPKFTLNPTSCEPMKVTGTATSLIGQSAPLASRFQVGGCQGLDFAPKLSMQLIGKTTRAKNPALKAVLTQPTGQANIKRVSVVLPKSEFIDNRHINNPCTRVQFNADACPASSILGRATAYSPLLAKPLTGPVYFRSNGGERELPDLVAALHGQIDVTVVGFIDSVKKKGTDTSRVRTRFQTVPDAPVSRFVLQLKGGKQGLLQNSENLCKGTRHAQVKMVGHNGKTHDQSPVVRVKCKSGRKSGK